MSIPFVSFSNDELKKRSRLESGQFIKCHKCGELHEVHRGKDEKGEKCDLVLFYKCGEGVYLAGVAGKCVI